MKIELTEREITQAIAEYVGRKMGWKSGCVVTTLSWSEGHFFSSSELKPRPVDPHANCAVPCGKDCTR
jgi:hypothetical protein